MRRVAVIACLALCPAAASAQQLGERIPGQRSEIGMPRAGRPADRALPACPEYGPGFVRLSSGTCARLGGEVRFEIGMGGGGSRNPSAGTGTRSGVGIELETRTQTDLGQLRAVVRGRATSDTGVMRDQRW